MNDAGDCARAAADGAMAGPVAATTAARAARTRWITGTGNAPSSADSGVRVGSRTRVAGGSALRLPGYCLLPDSSFSLARKAL
jgi:hypothetical protein